MTEPWTQRAFIDAIVDLQRRRQVRAADWEDQVQFHDRSVVCTAALATYLGYPVSDALAQELSRITTEKVYQRDVFLIRNLGFISPTDARRISFNNALRFERIHEEAYCELGFGIIFVEPGDLSERVVAIKRAVSAD